MKIKDISIKNFRLLEDVRLNIEEDITLIVGKNNTGKTSLFEVLNMFFSEKNNFSFYDFSQTTYTQFKECFYTYKAYVEENEDKNKEELEKKLISSIPNIQLEVQIEYDKDNDSLINLSEFISDLDDNKNSVVIRLQYQPKDTILLFKSFNERKKTNKELIEWLNENITSYYDIKCYGGDNLIEDNFKRKLLAVLCFENIQASRKLDDTKADRNRTLAVGFSDYYREVNKDNNNDVEELEAKLKATSYELEEKYKKVLDVILEKLQSFGVKPHLTIPEIVLQAGFDPESILKNNIKYFYKQNSITLPENYNGLGYSNLIYLVLKVVSFIEKFRKAAPLFKSEILTILIEEPEAHLHPQMQQIFITQIKQFVNDAKQNYKLAVQVIISTHSSHIVTEAGIDVDRSFERIRYFSKSYFKSDERYKVEIKDLNEFQKSSDKDTFRFLKQYMTLHRCDIFFADKIILVEGTTERILLPLMINKVAGTLHNEYVSIIEVGGAYTINFKEIIKFLNVKCLVITDIDSVNPADENKACKVDTPKAGSSNSTLIKWMPKKTLISELVACSEEEKFDTAIIRVAYQIPEDKSDYVARSLEEAIINRNKDFFTSKCQIYGVEKSVQDSFSLLRRKNIAATSPYDLAPESSKKTDFTFDLITFDEAETKHKWNVPKYIEEGLVWLANNEIEK